jgi:hypothetical protein
MQLEARYCVICQEHVHMDQRYKRFAFAYRDVSSGVCMLSASMFTSLRCQLSDVKITLLSLCSV